MRKLFSLSIETETIEALRMLAATRQLETGDKSSVTSLINEVVAKFLQKDTEATQEGGQNDEFRRFQQKDKHKVS